jgi:hypothetical protein
MRIRRAILPAILALGVAGSVLVGAVPASAMHFHGRHHQAAQMMHFHG